MPYLNWKESGIGQEVTPHPEGAERESLFALSLKSRELTELTALLEEVFVQNGPELRVDLPRKWVVFWKRREGESRLLIAHPNENEWVATAALDVEHGKRLITELKALQSGQAIHLSRLAAGGAHAGHAGMSNVELEIRRVQES